MIIPISFLWIGGVPTRTDPAKLAHFSPLMFESFGLCSLTTDISTVGLFDSIHAFVRQGLVILSGTLDYYSTYIFSAPLMLQIISRWCS